MPMQDLPKLSMYIDGEWVAPASGEYIETVDPFTAKPWALIPRGNAEDADRAVRAASVVEDGVAMVDREALREAAYFHRARKAPGRWQFCQHRAVDDAFYFRRA